MWMTTADWLIVGGYLLLSLFVGLFLARRASKSLSEFFLSGRNLPWWLAGTSNAPTTGSASAPRQNRGHGDSSRGIEVVLAAARRNRLSVAPMQKEACKRTERSSGRRGGPSVGSRRGVRRELTGGARRLV